MRAFWVGAPSVGAALESVYAIDERNHTTWREGIERALGPSVPDAVAIMSSLFRAAPTGDVETLALTPRHFTKVRPAVATLQEPAMRQTFFALPLASCIAEGDKPELWRTLDVLRAHLEGLPEVREVFMLAGAGADGIGTGAGFLLPGRAHVANPIRRQWARVALHIAAAARLRVGARKPECVMTPEGKVLQADGPAIAARDALRSAARVVDRVRSKKVSDPDEALTLWRVLTERRWSIADRFEENGRRFVVAYANEMAPVASLPALKPREMQVAALAALGHSNKEIAYELGVSVSSVAAHLSSAMRRLRVRSRHGIITRLRALRRGPAHTK